MVERAYEEHGKENVYILSELAERWAPLDPDRALSYVKKIPLCAATEMDYHEDLCYGISVWSKLDPEGCFAAIQKVRKECREDYIGEYWSGRLESSFEKSIKQISQLDVGQQKSLSFRIALALDLTNLKNTLELLTPLHKDAIEEIHEEVAKLIAESGTDEEAVAALSLVTKPDIRQDLELSVAERFLTTRPEMAIRTARRLPLFAKYGGASPRAYSLRQIMIGVSDTDKALSESLGQEILGILRAKDASKQEGWEQFELYMTSLAYIGVPGIETLLETYESALRNKVIPWKETYRGREVAVKDEKLLSLASAWSYLNLPKADELVAEAQAGDIHLHKVGHHLSFIDRAFQQYLFNKAKEDPEFAAIELKRLWSTDENSLVNDDVLEAASTITRELVESHPAQAKAFVQKLSFESLSRDFEIFWSLRNLSTDTGTVTALVALLSEKTYDVFGQSPYEQLFGVLVTIAERDLTRALKLASGLKSDIYRFSAYTHIANSLRDHAPDKALYALKYAREQTKSLEPFERARELLDIAACRRFGTSTSDFLRIKDLL